MLMISREPAAEWLVEMLDEQPYRRWILCWNHDHRFECHILEAVWKQVHSRRHMASSTEYMLSLYRECDRDKVAEFIAGKIASEVMG